MSQRTVIHWFRRDLRLTDNPALHAAAQSGARVIPVYVLSDWKSRHHWTGSKRQQFLCGCLGSLEENIKAIGSRLIFRCGRADYEIDRLLAETHAEAVYCNRDYDPFGRDMEKKVAAVCARHGAAFHVYKDRVLHEPAEVRTGAGDPYRVFTPYWRNWQALPKDQPLGKVRSLGPAARLHSEPVPTLDQWKLPAAEPGIIPAGERAARQRLKAFTEGECLTNYADKRDIPAGQTTSRLGQDLRFGLVSIRELHARCAAAATGAHVRARTSIETYVKELAWREFYIAILHEYPDVFEQEFNPEFRGMPWEGTDEHFHAWCEGRTGFPIVDAGMRQLRATGFMHNRVRMITAMFLTKDLHCDWRAGESFFMQHLVDGENASNNGGWQWSAGTGADAAPYFRIQNPWTQTKRYDRDGVYIKTWLPELKDVPAATLCEPPKDGRSVVDAYPAPIVDHARERGRALAAYARHRQK